MRFPCEVTLRGALFYDPPRAGELVTLCHEPDNPHDPRAVVVLADGRPVGYLPAPLAARVVSEFGDGVTLTGAVSFVRDDGRLVRVLVHGLAEVHGPVGVHGPAVPAGTPVGAGAGGAGAAPGAVAAGSTAASAGAAPAPGDAVRSPSGRPLGVVVEVTDADVVVDDSGRRCRYPAAMVLVVGAGPPEVG